MQANFIPRLLGHKTGCGFWRSRMLLIIRDPCQEVSLASNPRGEWDEILSHGRQRELPKKLIKEDEEVIEEERQEEQKKDVSRGGGRAGLETLSRYSPAFDDAFRGTSRSDMRKKEDGAGGVRFFPTSRREAGGNRAVALLSF